MESSRLIRIASSNIRFANPADGANDWPERRLLWAKLINQFSPCVLGTQEGREPQLQDAANLLCEMKLVADHREWIEERMYPCLFYNPKRVELIKSGDVWLSETPAIAGSKSFNSAFPRLCTWMEGRLIHSDKIFFFVNTHLDHVQAQTRIEQIKVLIKNIQTLNENDYPLILCGDFNDDPTSEVRHELMNSFSSLIDPWIKLKQPEETSHHKFCGINERGSRIDWILSDRELKARSIILDKTQEDGVWPSDHFIVKAEFEA